MMVAAVALPVSYVIAAVTLGDRIGLESVAIAWAVGYPIAFIVLIYMATHTLGWSIWKYGREVGGVAGCMVVSGLAAAGVRYLLGDVPPVITVAVTAATVVLVAGLLLAYTQGLSLRSVMRSLKDQPTAPPQAET
jgi:hypothetical protein